MIVRALRKRQQLDDHWEQIAAVDREHQGVVHSQRMQLLLRPIASSFDISRHIRRNLLRRLAMCDDAKQLQAIVEIERIEGKGWRRHVVVYFLQPLRHVDVGRSIFGQVSVTVFDVAVADHLLGRVACPVYGEVLVIRQSVDAEPGPAVDDSDAFFVIIETLDNEGLLIRRVRAHGPVSIGHIGVRLCDVDHSGVALILWQLLEEGSQIRIVDSDKLSVFIKDRVSL